MFCLQLSLPTVEYYMLSVEIRGVNDEERLLLT